MYRMIQFAMHRKVLNVHGGNAYSCCPITLWDALPGPPANELFYFEMVGPNVFYIASALNPNMVLNVEGGYLEPGTRVIVYPRQGLSTYNDKWRWNGEMIESCLGGVVLDVEGGKSKNGAQLIIWPPKSYMENANQRWRLL